MTTRYDAYPDHPLYGVPQEVLDAAREVMAEAVECHDVSAELADPLADAVVMSMHKGGFVTWPQEPAGDVLHHSTGVYKDVVIGDERMIEAGPDVSTT